jgi:TPR repeat protein
MGQGVAQDYTAAARWYRKAADQGNAFAQSKLGLMYARGQGVTQDYTAAVRWYRKAAGQGEAFAQTNLGFMYEVGLGVTQDYVQAHMWYNLAAAQSEKGAGKIRDLLAEKMTPEQIAEAQKLAREGKARAGSR